MYLSGSGLGDQRWLEKIAKHPPDSLFQLEYWFGKLDVDFAGGEGMGSVFRPVLPGNAARGSLRPEVKRLYAKFRWDMYHEHHERPRDMSLEGFDVTLDVGFATLTQILRATHGDPREIDTPASKGVVDEYGKWFYLRMEPNASARLEWTCVQPEWALPPVMPDSREYLLSALMDRLIVDTTVEPIAIALAPIVAAASGELHTWNPGAVDLSFRPGMPIELVTRVFGWDQPVSSSGDVHMSSWRLYQNGTNPWDPNIGAFCVDVRLDGWPRGPNRSELPKVDAGGASSTYDVRGCANTVVGISVRLPRR